jgi:hypothetical protein
MLLYHCLETCFPCKLHGRDQGKCPVHVRTAEENLDGGCTARQCPFPPEFLRGLQGSFAFAMHPALARAAATSDAQSTARAIRERVMPEVILGRRNFRATNEKDASDIIWISRAPISDSR